MFIWSDQTIGWFQDAAEYTHYYDHIAEHIRPFLKKDDTLCEIGCGLGYFSAALASKVHHITAVDISNRAICQMKKNLETRQITNVALIEANWLNWQPEKKFDAIIISYFNAIRKNWLKLTQLSRKYIIAVLANGQSSNNLICKNYSFQPNNEFERETVANVSDFLQTNHIPYTLIELELEFGQPLANYASAKQFLRHYYAMENEEKITAYLQKNLQLLSDGYYLPKIKKSGIIIIDLLI